MTNTPDHFAFILGREKEIALGELEAVLNRFDFCFDIYKITGNVAFAKIDNFSDNDAQRLMDTLGGTVKIFRLCHPEESKDLGRRPHAPLDSSASLQNDIRDTILSRELTGKVDYGISSYTNYLRTNEINRLGLEVKKKLKKDGKSVRFVALREGAQLSSIQSLKNNLVEKGVEIGIFYEGIGVLIALSDAEKWSKIDYDKPASDKYSGMLPPKLARMMVNVVLAEISSQFSVLSSQKQDKSSAAPFENWKLVTGNSDNCVVVDPFCGSGNVLLEGMLLGCEVVGSDKSTKAVEDTKKNIDWLIKEYPASVNKYQVFQADATEFDFKQLAILNKKLAIVSEPYLGKPKKFQSSFNATIAEYLPIKELYLRFIRNIKQLMVANKESVICVVFPLVETQENKRFSLFAQCVDEIKKLGYTQVRNSFLYGRDYQVVKREIILLKYQK